MRSLSFIWVLAPLAGAPLLSAGCAVELAGTGSGGGFTTANTAVSSTGTGGIGSTGTSSSGAGGAGGDIAASCVTDADCTGGLSCLTDASTDPIFGGGPAGGFCTRACRDDVDCAGAGGVCYKVDPAQPGRCTLPCELGPPIDAVDDLFAPLPPDKCRGREDLRCAKVSGNPICLPTCGSDAQCSGGRVCDPRHAVCVDVPSAGDPLGQSCDPTTPDTTCAGVCIGFESGATMCSRPCVLAGDALGSADCGGVDNGFCAFRPSANGPGDTGYCAPACAHAGDCQNPSFWCFTVPTITAQTQKGYCLVATPCPGGQADCIAANGANYICTDTMYGPLCLDPAFPPELPAP